MRRALQLGVVIGASFGTIAATEAAPRRKPRPSRPASRRKPPAPTPAPPEEPVVEPDGEDVAASEDDPLAGETEAGEETPPLGAEADVAAAELDEPVVADPHMVIAVSAGLGLVARAFDPMDSALARYRSSPVTAARFALEWQPAPRWRIAFNVDRSLQMVTHIDGGSVDTVNTRWQVSSALGGSRAVLVGIGRRHFTMQTTSELVTDGDYLYLALGGQWTRTWDGSALRIHGALEPVFAGEDDLEPRMGGSRRFGVAVGAELTRTLTSAVSLAASAEYEGFLWRWSDASGRDAMDHYPTAMVQVRATN